MSIPKGNQTTLVVSLNASFSRRLSLRCVGSDVSNGGINAVRRPFDVLSVFSPQRQTYVQFLF